MAIRMLPVPGRPRAGEAVLYAAPGTPALTGTGSVDFECWRCRFLICQGLQSVFDAAGRVFRCSACGTINRAPL